MNVSDRIAVIYDGQIVDTLDPQKTNEQELGLLMAGQTKTGAHVNQVKEEDSTNV
jgi:simple sugar transport system ATP-binding protein